MCHKEPSAVVHFETMPAYQGDDLVGDIRVLHRSVNSLPPTPTPLPPVLIPTPPILPFSESSYNKRKTSKSGVSNIGDTGFDGVKFYERHILSHSFISMDDASIRNHLQVLIQVGIRSAGVCSSLLKELDKTPLNTTQRSLEALQAEAAALQGEEKELEEEKDFSTIPLPYRSCCIGLSRIAATRAILMTVDKILLSSSS
ncbi:hypothetical protein Ahy_B10g101331 [Arachis hypogaea]|uniref:Uncharacterized protein n=1 Tax=Arachis hypogaea TaxID=3818 RepID=A0A444WZ93_ARAHY|nr:hypothetical protein Ahy_B10g101331 [Arachis hypogaea]